MSKNFKDILTMFLAGIVTIGALSAMGRTAKKDDEPKGEDVPFSFEQLDDPKSGWEVKDLSEVVGFENTVLRVYSNNNPGDGINFSCEGYDIDFYAEEYLGVGIVTISNSDAPPGNAEIIGENRMRKVEESGKAMVNGKEISYTFYYDFYFGEEFEVIWKSSALGDRNLNLKSEYMQYQFEENDYASCLVKEV